MLAYVLLYLCLVVVSVRIFFWLSSVDPTSLFSYLPKPFLFVGRLLSYLPQEHTHKTGRHSTSFFCLCFGGVGFRFMLCYILGF